MTLIAHSGNDNIAAQPYKVHVLNGIKRAKKLNKLLGCYLSSESFSLLESLVYGAFHVHDLGKLCPYSQAILQHQQIGKMPNHVDAGVAFLLKTKRTDDVLKAWIVKSHHWGYDDFPHTRRTGYKEFRDDKLLIDRCPWIFDKPKPPINGKMYEYTDSILPYLSELHAAFKFKNVTPFDIEQPYNVNGLFMRMALSVLVDADHFDTAKNYGNFVVEKEITLKPTKRLQKLDRYIKNLSQEKPDLIKDKIYLACRNSKETGRLVHCKSEVGTGKTTALMAYALKKAAEFKLRKIIYVAPFTNIISQTVKTYRDALVLNGEDELEIVAEHHHQVDFLADLQDRIGKQDPDFEESKIASIKKITTDWHSPIVCTTAVQFFETLAATGTGKLKKLNHLPGSVVIIDEAHSCIPPALWAMTLLWLKELADNFGCFVILASGSMISPWKNKRIIDLISKEIIIPSIIPEELATETLQREKNRVPITYNSHPYRDAESFCRWASSSKYQGPKVVICNTIKNAALIANCFRETYGDEYVKHLSTCLTPSDREKVLDSIKERLEYEPNRDWVLVATSCIEAGVDISFKYGFRENSSVTSVMQLAGRVSRNNEHYGCCELAVFELFLDFKGNNSIFTFNPDFIESRRIFRHMFHKHQGQLGPEHCEESFDLELQSGFKNLSGRYDPNTKITIEELLRAERSLELKTVKDHYNVITADKRTVIIFNENFNKDMLETASVTEVVRNSVQLYESQIDKNPVEKCKEKGFEDFLIWNGNYDNFLGYYADSVATYAVN